MKGRIKEKKIICKNFVHLVVEVEKEFNFEAGQFVIITFNIDGEKVSRAYSIASPPSLGKQRILEFGIKRKEGGLVSNYVYSSLEVGEEIEISESKGNMTLRNVPYDLKNFVFVAVGSGIAPFRSIILDLVERSTYDCIVLIHGNKYVDEIPYFDEFINLDKDGKIKYFPVISREEVTSPYIKGHVQDVLFNREFNLISSDRVYFICGMPNMVFDVKNKLIEKGVPEKNILYEAY